MPSNVYNAGLQGAFKGEIDLDIVTVKLLLVTSSYAPNYVTHTRRSHVTNEVVGTGYTAGGLAVAVAVTPGATGLDLVFAQAAWTLSTLTARAGVYYVARGGVAADDELLAYLDFGSNKSTIDGTLTVKSQTLRLARPA